MPERSDRRSKPPRVPAEQARVPRWIRPERSDPPPQGEATAQHDWANLPRHYLRRADLFAPRESREMQPAPGGGGVDYTSDIAYGSGRSEGAVRIRIHQAVSTLGGWEQVVFYALCAYYADGRHDTEGWIRLSLYEVEQRFVDRHDGRSCQRIREALDRLCGAQVVAGSVQMDIERWQGRRAIDRLVRVPVQHTFHLVSEHKIESMCEAADPRRRLWVRLGEPVTEAIAKRLVVSVPLDALRAIGPKQPAALRVYTYLLSQRARGGAVEVGCYTLSQIVRPARSWAAEGKGSRPGKFRQQVERIASVIAAADPRLSFDFADAQREAGGWKMVATKVRPTKDDSPTPPPPE